MLWLSKRKAPVPPRQGEPGGKGSVLAVIVLSSASVLSGEALAAEDAQIQKLEAAIERIEARHQAEIRSLQAEIRQLRRERPEAAAAKRRVGPSPEPAPPG